MAATNRLRYNGLLCGTAAPTLGAGISSGGTTITFPAALKYNGTTAVPTVADPDYVPLIINPDTAAMEIVWLTAYTSGATTGTILRAQESTAASAHGSGSEVSHGPTALDFASGGGGGGVTPGDRMARSQSAASPQAVTVGNQGSPALMLDNEDIAVSWATWDISTGVTITEDGNYAVLMDVDLDFVTPPTSGYVLLMMRASPSPEIVPVIFAPWDAIGGGQDIYIFFTEFYAAGTVLDPTVENDTDEDASLVWAAMNILRVG